ncbi:uncharacterized protein DFL_006307 [Arthrobotrys flagrans]|uniref:Uncharacterized protein n=1 Tax=Arthrobotrys flagrans TaxID=97331 RepID=A0A436ZZZ5_ARTFL|nr:hypothetical protein DFL_006307 [Arthrobotrys flagrans]
MARPVDGYSTDEMSEEYVDLVPAPSASTLGDPERSRPLKEVGEDYSSNASIGSQNFIIALSHSHYQYGHYYCYHYFPISLKSSFIRSARVRVNIYDSLSIAGSLKILSVPLTFEAPRKGFGSKEFTALHSLFDCSNIQSEVYDEDSNKMLVVMNGNVAPDVTCLHVLPLTSKISDRGCNCEGSEDIGYDVPSDRCIIVLFTLFIHRYQHQRSGWTNIHIFVNLR